jgi:hypothetical protein
MTRPCRSCDRHHSRGLASECVQAEARADRILEYVLARGAQIVVVLDEPGREAVTEQVAGTVVPLVEPLGVQAVEAVHAVGEVGPSRVGDDVVVGVHQDEGVDVPAPAACGLGEE